MSTPSKRERTVAPLSTRELTKDLIRLALPALVVLAAEPLYILFDTALVGHLGAVELAALAAGGTILSVVSAQLTFLSYGTTARSARFHGAQNAAAARMEGVQATWLALGVGILILILTELFLDPITRLLTGGHNLGVATEGWLRIALFGVPFILVSMAGNGWMRGVQEVRQPPLFVVSGFAISAILCPALIYGWDIFPRLGVLGSAWANVTGQVVTGLLFLARLIHQVSVYKLSLRPQWSIIREQLRMGSSLIVRSLGFQVCFLSVSAVAARIGADALAAHQIVWQLWVFTSLVLDSVAVAAQSLVGEALGRGERERTQQLATKFLSVGVIISTSIALLYAALSQVLPRLFTRENAVLDLVLVPWWFMVALLPVAGALFACDGVLLGAGDAAFLRNVTAISAFFGYLPVIWLSYSFHWGLIGLWSGFALFISARAVAGIIRQWRGRWIITGTPVA